MNKKNTTDSGNSVYTIGHSTRTIEVFTSILSSYSIELLVDVRRFPYSRKFPWFNRENLCCVLKENGIDYEWLGENLGGFRKGGYAEFTKTKQYLSGIKRLIELGHKGVVCIMCAEILWFRCHRRFISNTLAELGVRVKHIYDKHKIYEHKPRLQKSDTLKWL